MHEQNMCVCVWVCVYWISCVAVKVYLNHKKIIENKSSFKTLINFTKQVYSKFPSYISFNFNNSPPPSTHFFIKIRKQKKELTKKNSFMLHLISVSDIWAHTTELYSFKKFICFYAAAVKYTKQKNYKTKIWNKIKNKKRLLTK